MNGQHTLNVNLYSSLNISGLLANWAATSGNLDCIPLHESAFKALQPCRNSCLVNLHICSAPNCQARTERKRSKMYKTDFYHNVHNLPRTLNSSGFSCKSMQNSSIPSDRTQSSSSSLYFSYRADIFVSEKERDSARVRVRARLCKYQYIPTSMIVLSLPLLDLLRLPESLLARLRLSDLLMELVHETP